MLELDESEAAKRPSVSDWQEGRNREPRIPGDPLDSVREHRPGESHRALGRGLEVLLAKASMLARLQPAPLSGAGLGRTDHGLLRPALTAGERTAIRLYNSSQAGPP
jgi:hypothetical protein